MKTIIKSKFLGVLCFLFLINILYGNAIDTNTAKTVVETFWKSTYLSNIQKNTNDFQLVYQAKATQKDYNQETFYYVYNVSGQGFVIISGDDRVTPILGYSNENSFDPNQIPPALAEILKQYQQTIEYVIKNNVPASNEITVSWQNLKTGHPLCQKATQTSVEPLIKTNWSQSKPYNNLCPLDTSQMKHCVTGCVATAMAQMLYYWKKPTHGYGAHSYILYPYGTLYADFQNTVYQYDSMLPTYADTNAILGKDEIATLMYHCGVSVNMNYGVESSGAQLIENQYNYQNAEKALKNYFGFYEVIGKSKYEFTDSEWINLIKNDLDSGRPVLYAGSNIGSHAFICDGYDENDYFHFNWGWNGHYNGYFLLSNLTPTDCDFSGNQQAIFNIKTVSFTLTPDSTNIVYVTPEGAGNEDGSSWDNATPNLAFALGNCIDYPHTIWVKKGIYHGDTNSNTAFILAGGNKMYGGFAGNEGSDYDVSLRTLDSNKTVLDGQKKQQVLTILESSDEKSLCDGFVICNGFLATSYALGGGVFMDKNSLLKNCIIENNSCTGDYSFGGGVFTFGDLLINCIIRANSSENCGGGIYNNSESFTLINSVVASNTATSGAGIVSSGNGTYINSDIINNIAYEDGGGFMINNYENEEVINCILWGNYPNQCTNNSNLEYSNCALQDIISGFGNFTLEAENNGIDTSKNYVRFEDFANGNYQLMKNSACIDAGSMENYPFDTLTGDLYGNARIINNLIDIGACEYTYYQAITDFTTNESIIIYPNPITSFFNVYISDISNHSYFLTLYDNEGKIILNQSINSNLSRINLPIVSKGLYFVQLQNENLEQKTYTIVIK